jgi:predicted dinucleotide-binding enzyme
MTDNNSTHNHVPTQPVVGILGGTGPQGLGLARRFAESGLTVIIGSRSAERARESAATLEGSVRGLDNQACAAECDIAIVAVPYDGHADLLLSLREQLAGKIVVDCVNPMGFDGKGPYALAVPEGSACEQAQECLPSSIVTGAFHHLSAVHLADPGRRPGRGRGNLSVGRGDPRRARRLRRTSPQRPPGRGADREPDRDQPPLQGARRTADHGHLTRR